MRKILLVASVVILVILTGCTVEFEFPTTEENKAIIYKPIPKPDDVQYFQTIEEAITHNTLVYYADFGKIIEPIKMFKHNSLLVFFYKSSINNEDVVYVIKSYVTEGEDTQYSPPFMGTRTFWKAHKNCVKMFNCDETGEIRLGIVSSISQFLSVDRTKTFVWGLSQTEKVSNLKIEGQPVTEVIEVELDGEKGYFWYFDDLKTDKSLMCSNPDRYTEGELVITME